MSLQNRFLRFQHPLLQSRKMTDIFFSTIFRFVNIEPFSKTITIILHIRSAEFAFPCRWSRSSVTLDRYCRDIAAILPPVAITPRSWEKPSAGGTIGTRNTDRGEGKRGKSRGSPGARICGRTDSRNNKCTKMYRATVRLVRRLSMRVYGRVAPSRRRLFHPDRLLRARVDGEDVDDASILTVAFGAGKNGELV